MLNEVLRLTQGDLTSVIENRPISRDGENGKCAHGVQFEVMYRDTTRPVEFTCKKMGE